MVLINKILEIKLDVEDETALCVNYEANIIKILENKLLNKCYHNILILKINNLKCISDPEDCGNGSRIYCSICVIFEVMGLYYKPGEIIADAKIIKKINTNTPIICKSKYASISYTIKNSHLFSKDFFFNTLQVEQIIPIRVCESVYRISTSEISVNAELLTPITYKENYIGVYKLEPFTPSSGMALLIKRMNEVENQYQQLSKDKVKRDMMNFYVKLYYGYDEFKTIPDNEKIDILTLTDGKCAGKKQLIIKYTPRMKLNERFVELVAENQLEEALSVIKMEKNKIMNIGAVRKIEKNEQTTEPGQSSELTNDFVKIKFNSEIVVGNIIETYIINLQFLMDLCEIFTPEYIKKYMNYFKLMTLLKIKEAKVEKE